jgi:probable phosphoglycerate mutase
MPEGESEVTIWVVRHGETEWSEEGRHTGCTDVPLTARGEDLARGLRSKLAGRRFTLVVTSPLQRARRTAELAGFSDAEVWGDLHEWDYGDYEGMTRGEIQERRPDWWLWTDGCPGGESPGQMTSRVDAVVERCAGAGGDVLMFAHGHLLRSLAARWIGQPVSLGAHLDLYPARVNLLGNDRGTPTLQLWNSPEPPP